MLDFHRRMLAFDHWASTASLDAVAPVADRVPASLAWLNHIVGAKRVWLARVTETEMPFGVNPRFSAAELRHQFEEAHRQWLQFLDSQSPGDVARIIHYRNLKGEPFSSPLGEILAHVPLHGQHHRGQINTDLRAAGIAPPTIDFIHAARSGAI
jgi:uncharacterized damage-inducible protein DinB